MLTFWPQRNPYVRYVRCELPARALGGHVWDIDVIRNTVGVDVVSVNEGPAVWQILSNGLRLKQAHELMSVGVPSFLEVDDNYATWDGRYSTPDWTRGMPDDPRMGSVALHKKIAGLMDGVICATPHLASIYSSLSRNVHVCPNSVHPDDWPEPLARDDTFRIMWMASACHRVDQHLVVPALEWASEQEGVEVYVFGAQMRSEKLIFVPWEPDGQSYREKMVELRPDVGLCPVEINDFSRGKSDLKPMEYAMAGAMPVITPFEPYDPWVGKSDACLQALAPADWREAVEWCVEHRDDVRRMALKAREYVLSERTISQCADSWLVATGQLAVV